MEESRKNSNRNYYIDFVRGLAIISVILIHTVWHSGEKYIPVAVRNLSLLFEVPVFFFIAGWAYSYTKSNKKYIGGLLKLQFKYMVYMSIVFIILSIVTNNKYNLFNLVNWFFHSYSGTYPLRSISYSLWFLKTYFMSVICCIAIITFCPKKYLKYLAGIFLMLIVLQTFNIKYFSIVIGLNVSLNYIIFYSFIFILGYLLKEFNMKNTIFVLCMLINIILLIIFKNCYNYDIFNLQVNKYKTNLIWLLWSMFGIYIVVFFKKYCINMKENLICKLGQKSMYLYFSQGISSSLLYFIIPYIKLSWYFKLPIMFLINVVMAIPIMFILEFVIERVLNLPKYILKLKGNKNEENM